MSSGTGSLIDKNRKLILTNYHVVGDEEKVYILFPEFAKGKLVAEKNHYLSLLGTQKGGIEGKVLHRDPKRDLAVIQINSVPATAQVIHLSRDGVGTAQQVHSIGNPGKSDALWEYTSGTVRSVHSKKWAAQVGNTVLQFEAKVVETQSPTNQGDSGGPLVDKNGELVGVTQGMAKDAQLLSFFIDVSEVRAFLKKNDLLAKLPQGRSANDKAPTSGGKSEDKLSADDKAEREAGVKLKFAKELANAGKVEAAKDRCEKIIKDYSKTKAATEAKTLLDQLNK
jgi:S1-C subfamily serine protease